MTNNIPDHDPHPTASEVILEAAEKAAKEAEEQRAVQERAVQAEQTMSTVRPTLDPKPNP